MSVSHPNNIRSHRAQFEGTQLGLSLVEMMVALAIGVLLLLGLVEIFGATRAAFSAAEGSARAQEAGRFVTEFLKRDLRVAGHVGCLNERAYLSATGGLFVHMSAGSAVAAAPYAFRVDYPIQAYEYVGTAPGSAVDLSAGAAVATANGAWSPVLPADLDALINDAVIGSDVLVVRFLSPEFVDSVIVNIATAQLQITDPVDEPFFTDKSVYGVTNCRKLSLVQAASAPLGGIVNVGVAGLNAVGWSAQFEDGYAPPGTTVHHYNYVVYYVGMDAASGQPSLKRRNLDVAAGPFLGASETLVDGVESLQLVLGADTSVPQDDQVDIYDTATGITALAVGADDPARWRRVVTARMGVITRSPNPSSAVRDAAASQIRLADAVFTFANDGRVRQSYETLITLRNRNRN